jgi:hypothetical protein
MRAKSLRAAKFFHDHGQFRRASGGSGAFVWRLCVPVLELLCPVLESLCSVAMIVR